MESNTNIEYDQLSNKLTVSSLDQFTIDQINEVIKWQLVEIVNFSGSWISCFPDRLKVINPSVIFASNCNFTSMPDLSEHGKLKTLALKSCGIKKREDNMFPTQLQRLMLTDNKISKIPQSIWNLKDLRKVALAGNQIVSLPDNMQNCSAIELLRISANNFSVQPPSWLLDLPVLRRYSHGWNMFQQIPETSWNIPNINYQDLTIQEKIGESPSSTVYRAEYDNSVVAVKVFKWWLTSDGYPEDDKRFSIMAWNHPNLIQILWTLIDHPEDKSWLILKYISDYSSLWLPPSLQTCTRDTYPDGKAFEISYIVNVLLDVSAAASKLHDKKILHGDIYAHNTLSKNDWRSLLWDFGAASYYGWLDNESKYQSLDMWAYWCLIQDLLNHCNDENAAGYKRLREIEKQCISKIPKDRPSFQDIHEQLQQIL